MKTTAVLRFLILAVTIKHVIADGGLRGTQFHRRLDDSGLPGIEIEIPFCFSEKATVQVEGRGTVAMKDLAVGDSVLVGRDEFQPVYAFAHKHATKATDFVQIHTDAKEDGPLELSGQHMLYVNGRASPVLANSVRFGDELRGADEGSNKRVTKVRSVHRAGVYAPLTPKGTIVVDGILASNYVSFQESSSSLELEGGYPILSQQQVAHMALSPFRMLCVGKPVGFLARWCEIPNEEDKDKPSYVAALLDLGHWLDGQPMAVQVFVLAVLGLLFVPCRVVEGAFGASWVASSLLATAGCLAIYGATGRFGKLKKG